MRIDWQKSAVANLGDGGQVLEPYPISKRERSMAKGRDRGKDKGKKGKVNRGKKYLKERKAKRRKAKEE